MRELFDHRRHQSARASGPRVLLEVVDLTHQIARRASGNSGNGCKALEVRAMAARARRGDARPARPGPRLGQGLALGDAAFWYVRDELRTGVAMFELFH